MKNNKLSQSENRPAGIGTGYLSLMMIFVVLCLAMLSALSLSASVSEQKYSSRSAEYTKAYYSADSAAKRTLAEIYSIAGGYDDYSDFMLISELEELENVAVKDVPDGTVMSWTTPINERQKIYSEVKITGNRIEVTRWQTILGESPAEDAPLGVWSGE